MIKTHDQEKSILKKMTEKGYASDKNGR